MFENVLGQAAVAQIRQDAEAGRLAPSMLFWGPAAAGKGSAALELARFLSCEQPPPGRGRWNCPCAACALHRLLSHPDMLVLGSRPFASEIAAARDCLLREKDSPAAPVLFFRALRKLTGRFSPVLWEDDTKLGKIAPLLSSIEEDLEDLDRLLKARKEAAAAPEQEQETFEKNLDRISGRVVKNAFELEAEGIAESVPIAQIRRAAAWSHLAPVGRGKFILIENADRMQEGARNSLLKILEEPPAALTIVLSTTRREAILPTLLSRLRPYRFMRRDPAAEEEVIRRIFRAGTLPAAPAGEGNRIAAYLDSFLPVSPASLRPLAAFFAASLAKRAIVAARKRGTAGMSAALVRIGLYCGPVAAEAGLGLSTDSREIASAVLAGTDNFSPRSLFSRFIGIVLGLVSESFVKGGGPEDGGYSPAMIVYNDIWNKCTGEAVQAALVWNQSPALTLDRLVNVLVSSMEAVQ
ncbi:MAG: DNA polymerase III subunit [Treponema sp.]|jgi:DNA polymerase-3 subunit gamma/tau|nr:DNA polymerase III subunit [Treponema sp.]